jgi:hypothetical protein
MVEFFAITVRKGRSRPSVGSPAANVSGLRTGTSQNAAHEDLGRDLWIITSIKSAPGSLCQHIR